MRSRSSSTNGAATAHAVLSARKAIMRGVDDVLVIFADTPLVRAETLLKLRAALAKGAAVAVLGFNAADPTGYGRLLTAATICSPSASTATRRRRSAKSASAMAA